MDADLLVVFDSQPEVVHRCPLPLLGPGDEAAAITAIHTRVEPLILAERLAALRSMATDVPATSPSAEDLAARREVFGAKLSGASVALLRTASEPTRHGAYWHLAKAGCAGIYFVGVDNEGNEVVEGIRGASPNVADVEAGVG